MKDFNLYKKIISLPDFLINNFGFKVHPKGSTKNSPKLTDGNITILIRKREDMYTYCDINNMKETKSILDFMQEYLKDYHNGVKPPLPIVANLLDRYITEGKTVLPEFSSFSINNPSLSSDEVNRNILHLQKEGNTDFLIKRGFSEKTLQHENFKSIIHFRNIFDKDGSHKTDVAFIMYGLESKAISFRGTQRADREGSFKGFQGPKSNCIASSHFDPSKPLNSIFIGESMIDNMAHFELNYKDLKNQNVLYISTEGSIADNQIKLVQYIINKHQPQNITMIFDNDLYGAQASTKFLSELGITSNLLGDTPKKENASLLLNLLHVDSTFSSNKIQNSSIFFTFPNKNLPLFLENLDPIINKTNQQVSKNDDLFNLKLHSQNNTVSKFELTFKNTTENWKKTNSILHEFKFNNSPNIGCKYPKQKDYNQDLVSYKGLSHIKPKQQDKPLSL